jgi:hypothetical protein
VDEAEREVWIEGQHGLGDSFVDTLFSDCEQAVLDGMG